MAGASASLGAGTGAGWRERLVGGEDAEAAIELTADVAPLIERNKRLANDGDGMSASREWRRLASYPPIVVEIVKRRWGADPLATGNEELLRRMINDPELRHFRTSTARL